MSSVQWAGVQASDVGPGIPREMGKFWFSKIFSKESRNGILFYSFDDWTSKNDPVFGLCCLGQRGVTEGRPAGALDDSFDFGFGFLGHLVRCVGFRLRRHCAQRRGVEQYCRTTRL